MKKEIIYTYLGTNGTLSSHIHLEGIPSVKKYRLTAQEGYILMKDNMKYGDVVHNIPEDEVDEWSEVLDKK